MFKEKTLRCAIKKPGKEVEFEVIDNTLEAFQKVVGGLIEVVTLCSDLVIVCNEEGRLLGLEPNCSICGVDFVGTIIFCGKDGDEFADLPCTASEFNNFIFTRKGMRKEC